MYLFVFIIVVSMPCIAQKTIQLNKNIASNYSSEIANVWVNHFSILERWIAGMRPTVSARALAYISIGAYETVLPAMPNYVSNQTKISGLKLPKLSKPIESYNWNIALNAYYAKSDSNFLLGALPIWKESITHLKDSLNTIYKPTVSQKVYDNSVEWGLQVADAIYKYAVTDKIAETDRSMPYPEMFDIPKGKGYWIGEIHGGYKPFTPHWGGVRTFTTFGNDLLSPPPPKYDTNKNSQYYKEHLEVYNEWKHMNYEKRWRAEFWSDDIVPFTFGPSVRIYVIAKQMAEKDKINLEKTLYLYCKLGIGLNDATAACWKNKYIYNTERPWQYIKPNIDSSYRSIMGEAVDQAGKNPPFPGYPSGHSSCAGVGQMILAEFFGENYLFTDYSHLGRKEFNSTPRTFTSMKEMAEENAYSRIPMGAHVRFDCDEGLRLGRLVGMNTVKYDLTKKH